MKNNTPDRTRRMTWRAWCNWRANHGLTQKEAAKLLGVSVRTVENWEQGRNPPPETVMLLMSFIDKEMKSEK